MRRGSTIEYAPVGDTLQNGYDLGGARIYPYDAGLAIHPPAYYGNYIGSAQGLPVVSPVASLAATSGAPTSGARAAMANPFGRQSPLPWVVGGLVVALLAVHFLHYAPRKGD